jgi:2-dehydropantoate 2-reductase
MRIAIVGGGAMGSIYAMLLKQSPHEVWLIDIWPEHIDAIRQHGLCVEGIDGHARSIRINATLAPEEVGPADLVIVAVKAYQTATAAPTIRRLATDGSIVLGMQNGLGNGERLSAAVPQARVAVGVPGHGGALLGPGRVAHRVAALTPIGWLAGPTTDELSRIAETFTSAGLESCVVDDISTELWAHVMVVAGVNAIAALCRVPNIEVARVPEAARLSELAIREVAAVAEAYGVRLPWDDPVSACRAVYLANGEHHLSSMTLDILRERPTEIDVLNGAIVEYGRHAGVATPVNEALWLAVKTVEHTLARRAEASR